MNLPNARGPKERLGLGELYALYDALQLPPSSHGLAGDRWTRQNVIALIRQDFGVEFHPNHVPRILDKMTTAVFDAVASEPFFRHGIVALYLGDAVRVMQHLPSQSVDCIVTSPPYYGQRDYGVAGQLGLEDNPDQYVSRLVETFRECRRLLKVSGSLWVNLGDTYWSGKGKSQGNDLKGRYRRFLRPQDRVGPKPLCVPKQLLLIPHRFAIAMQTDGWILRNDNVWYKTNPTPDPVDDRCASSHEYVFHFVRSRRYYFCMSAVAEPSRGNCATKAPASVWKVSSAPTFKKHIAVFPPELVRIPLGATLPSGGVLLDPFCGSGTALSYALDHSAPSRLLGIDISRQAIAEAASLLSNQQPD